MIGYKIGNYEFLERLGAGGMGEVYRARDTSLMRDVAIKILPAALAQDPERMTRFRREAQVLASFTHPNIAAAYGLETDGSITCLVMELVPGRTLLDLIERRELGMPEAFQICRQIAEALEVAHAHGVIHRDLKPANVNITPDGTAKVLDFGLAKMVESVLSQSNPDSATFMRDSTKAGMILGTPAYMSPEQARGKPVDERTDIWALGCVLYQTLTGKPPFGGQTPTDALVSTIHHEPDWSLLPAATPGRARELMRWCLQKDPKRRLHHIADARILIEEALQEPPAVVTAAVPAGRGRWTSMLAMGLMAAAALGVAAWSLLHTRPEQARPAVAIPIVPDGQLQIGYLAAAVLSPDGTRLVYAASRSGRTVLYQRALDRFETTAVAGSEGASGPFFSPDGSQIGFFADGKLKRVPLDQGTPVVLADAPIGRGGTWGPDGTIVFAATNRGGLFRLSVAGGGATPLTTLDAARRDRSHRLPHFLPDGRTVLFTVEVSGALFDEARIETVSLDTGERRTVQEGGYAAQYSPSGHVIFARGGELVAVPFDPRRLQVTGSPVRLPEHVMQNAVGGSAEFQIASGGAAVYRPSTETFPEGTLVWVDRGGDARPASETRRPFYAPSLSPDAQSVAVSAVDGVNRDIWVLNLQRGSMTRLTSDPALDAFPIWTRDARKITFSSSRAGARNLFWVVADGSTPAERLTTSPNTQFPGSWTLDGRLLVFDEADPTTGYDLWTLPVENGVPGTPKVLLQTAFSESSARLSPDGAWLAYVSDESGRPEVVVRAFPGLTGKTQVSANGGTQPVWGANGRELYFRQADRVFSVAMTTSPAFKAGRPQLLFARDYDVGPGGLDYDVMPDGKQFLMVRGSDPVVSTAQLNVVLGWAGTLKQGRGAAAK